MATDLPEFSGSGYDSRRDKRRLTNQLELIKELMKDRKWRTLAKIARMTGAPESSVSAQLRHLRKERFGSWEINKRHIGGGLYEYQMRKQNF